MLKIPSEIIQLCDRHIPILLLFSSKICVLSAKLSSISDSNFCVETASSYIFVTLSRFIFEKYIRNLQNLRIKDTGASMK